MGYAMNEVAIKGPSPEEKAHFRRVLGHYPTGVCGVTAIGATGIPVGMIVGSFTSVSLDPMLVGFFPDRSSTTWPKIEAAGRFCVNVLGDCQGEICKMLGSKDADRFERIPHILSGLGSPLIDGALAWIDCSLEAVHDAGDHYFALGRVQALELHADGSPLLFHKGAYSKIMQA
jgi:3-hydroxy-9,10-secoandrosta-1,3,5(10)-triene-9,17-dione monooxygenase reductase component